LKLSIYEVVFILFAKSECPIQIIKHIWTETCISVENQFKISDIVGKMVLTPLSSTTTPC